MTNLLKTGIFVGAAIAATTAIVPAVKGPFNRWRTEINDKLNAEYVVDNYKIEYVKLHEKRAKLLESISKFNVERKVAEKKLAIAVDRMKSAKNHLVAVGPSNLTAFAKAKDMYESFKTEVSNLSIMTNTYSQAVEKLEKSLAIVEVNMSKAKLNVDTLASKKTMLDAIEAVNTSIENMNGTGDSTLAVNVEKLDDDLLRESIKLDALDKTPPSAQMTEADAKAYLQSLK